MLRTRRRYVPVTSDSSEDESPQPRRQTRSSSQTQNFSYSHNTKSMENQFLRRSNRRKVDRREDDSSSVLRSRKLQKKLPLKSVIISEESSSSGNEEILHGARRSSLRALSDYETGNSTDKASETSTHEVRNKQVGNLGLVTNSVQRDVTSESSSDESIIQIRSVKRHITQFNPLSTTDTSDSGTPIGFMRSRKRMKLCSSSEEIESGDSSHNDPNTRAMVGQNRTVQYSDRPTTSRVRSLVIQRANQHVRNRDSSAGTRSNGSSLLNTSGRRNSAFQSYHAIARALRRSNRLIFASENMSSSDSDENFPRQNQIRRGAHVALYASDEDDGILYSSRSGVSDHDVVTGNSKAVQTDKTLISQKNNISCGISSDSDGESEKCSICLARFTLQEVGTPATCNHSFCAVCIKEWAKNNNTCPVDRKQFNSIIVCAHYQGKVIHEIPVETPQPSVQGNGDYFLNLFNNLEESESSEESQLSDYDSNEEGPDEVCCICHQRYDIFNMIICDQCYSVYHMNCVVPPLHYVPVSDWYCPDCEDVEEV